MYILNNIDKKWNGELLSWFDFDIDKDNHVKNNLKKILLTNIFKHCKNKKSQI